MADKRGKIILRHRIYRDMLVAEREKLFVFGDNMARRGLGGQAREMRGEPNAVGIPTKWRPSMQDAAFFGNDDLPKVKPAIDEAFAKLRAHVEAGGDVVWPEDGIGTGLARLDTKAPEIARHLEVCLAALRGLAD